MGKKIQPPWHLHADLQDCGTRRWCLPVTEDTIILVDEPTRAVRRDGVAVPLEPRPFDMLMIFLRRPLAVVTKTELRQLLWGDRAISDHVLTKCISKLRFALERPATLPAAPPGSWLTAVYGKGYRLAVRPVSLPPGAGARPGREPTLPPHARPDPTTFGERHDPLWLLRQAAPGPLALPPAEPAGARPDGAAAD